MVSYKQNDTPEVPLSDARATLIGVIETEKEHFSCSALSGWLTSSPNHKENLRLLMEEMKQKTTQCACKRSATIRFTAVGHHILSE